MRVVEPRPDAPSPGATLEFTCPSCGAETAYAPGTTTMKCPKCGAEEQIDGGTETIDEHSYKEWAALPERPVGQIGEQVLQCDNCGATTETDLIADTCRFCKGVLVAVQNPEGLIAPEAVVPFGIAGPAAVDAFRKWVRSRWFAPSALKRVGSTDSIKGTYIPHWTFDAHTETDYEGQRGEHYYTTEFYTVSNGKGGTRTESRQVQHTRWYPASGHLQRNFDDVLVPASHRLTEKQFDKMGPWHLADAQAYQPEYLAGYAALRYDVDPDDGLTAAKESMRGQIHEDCESDIGGDEQRVSAMDVHYGRLMFKLVLLPIWIASYLYGPKTYQVLVNANTGEVIGDRPYSKLKITAATVLLLTIVAAIVLVATLH
jgi:Zn finger protein HypA/HybF involved in hydrogenase expression